MGKLLWIGAVACDGAECKLAWTDSPDNGSGRDVRGKNWHLGRYLIWIPRKGRSSKRGLSQGRIQERGTPPLSPKAEQEHHEVETKSTWVNWIDEGNLPAKLRWRIRRGDKTRQEQSQGLRQWRNKISWGKCLAVGRGLSHGWLHRATLVCGGSPRPERVCSSGMKEVFWRVAEFLQSQSSLS